MCKFASVLCVFVDGKAYIDKNFIYAKDYRKIRLGYTDDGRKILKFGIEGDEVEIEPAAKWKKDGNAIEKIAQLKDFLFKMKENILGFGVLHYDDCYYLGDTNIREHPDIIDILRNRFAYVFVDEAQDMKGFQLNIIDKCFNCDSVVLQRIGDPNQAIFDGFSMENSWESRNPSFLNNSLRLTQEVASVVDHLVLDRGDDGQGGARFVVNGVRPQEPAIPRYLLLYTQDTIGGLKEKFKDVIRSHHLESIAEAEKYGFHIVGWNSEAKNDADHRRLEDIFPEYHRRLSKLNANPRDIERAYTARETCRQLQGIEEGCAGGIGKGCNTGRTEISRRTIFYSKQVAIYGERKSSSGTRTL